MKIRKDIPVPKSTNRSGRKPSYPFLDMLVGDSFQVEGEKLLAVRTAAWRQNKGGQRKFRVDQHGKGWRCWRVA
jgi:hypothetical protein